MPANTAAKPKVPTITPYLTVKGADAAIALYQKAFGAKQKERMTAQDGKRVMHAAIAINGGTVMLSDEFPEHGGPGAPSAEHPAPVAVTIQYQKPTQVD
ncbi:MAG TPA: VOC family protein, partial [Hyphomicrobiaceae bacterium]|nr:VOC family protein [Hyphomicrobiaceae bacterium]